MDQQTIGRAKVTLAEAIDQWFDKQAESLDLPYVGINTVAIMAGAAVSVLVAVADVQDYLRDQGMFKD